MESLSADPDLAPDRTPATRRAALRRELIFLGAFGGFGIVLLPFAVYLAGAATLGPYEGGLLSFLGKLYGDFVTLSPAALVLLFGPYLLFQAVRLLTRPLRRRAADNDPQN
jgi:hypothetical protein